MQLPLPELPPVRPIELPPGADPNAIQVPGLGTLPTVARPDLGAGPTFGPNAYREQLGAQVSALLGGGLSREELVREQFQNLRPILQENFQNAVTQTGRQAAAFGRGGLGSVATQFAELPERAAENEARILSDLITRAKEAEMADRFQALGLLGQLSGQLSEEELARAGLLQERDIAGAEFGLRADLAGQEAALRSGLQGQQLGFQASQARAGLQESAADRALQAGLQGQQLESQQALGQLQSATQIKSAQIHASATTAAARAQAEATKYGADQATARAMAQLAYQKEADRMSNLFRAEELSESARRFDVGTAFNERAFQYGMQRDVTDDYFRTIGLAGDLGYRGAPDLNSAQQYIQQALGAGASNYGAQAGSAYGGAGSAAGLAGGFLYDALRPKSQPITFDPTRLIY